MAAALAWGSSSGTGGSPLRPRGGSRRLGLLLQGGLWDRELLGSSTHPEAPRTAGQWWAGPDHLRHLRAGSLLSPPQPLVWALPAVQRSRESPCFLPSSLWTPEKAPGWRVSPSRARCRGCSQHEPDSPQGLATALWMHKSHHHDQENVLEQCISPGASGHPLLDEAAGPHPAGMSHSAGSCLPSGVSGPESLPLGGAVQRV